MRVEVFAPGRVNLIGDHTDYCGGLALPMAIDLGTTFSGSRGGDLVRLSSSHVEGELTLPLEVTDPTAVVPQWGRYVAGVLSVIKPAVGIVGTITSTLPIGAGLSSSAALELTVALALGFQGSPLELALACQQAEQVASGVPCGVMDQLVSAAGAQGHALLMDCGTLTTTPVQIPPEVDVVVVDSGERRRLADSAYQQRRFECEQAQSIVGPLRRATLADLEQLDDSVLRRRARHVVTENGRVVEFVEALKKKSWKRCGKLMIASHRSLTEDFAVSTLALDHLVDRLVKQPGVFGARLTGAGLGGCVVALTEPGAMNEGWHVRPSAGAHEL